MVWGLITGYVITQTMLWCLAIRLLFGGEE